jgi:hypothetical protein
MWLFNFDEDLCIFSFFLQVPQLSILREHHIAKFVGALYHLWGLEQDL